MSEPIEFDEKGNVVLHINWKVAFKVVVILGLAIGSYFLPLPGLTTASRISLMLFVGAAGFWVTEVIPPFATAIAVIVLSVYALGAPGGPLELTGTGLETSYRVFLNPIASPVLVLFFGGFILAIAAAKHGFDVRLARIFLKPFGTKPKMVLLGVILITAVFSMFMSNTATTAMMVAILTPLFGHFEGRNPFKKALVLSVPFAANIGGIGTIIGTPPNAVAASVLGNMGAKVSFFQWMMVGVPMAIVLLFFLWVLLLKVFKPRQEEFEILFPEDIRVTWDLVIVVVTFVVTLVMWLTEPLHGIPSAVVALLPIFSFTVFGILDRDDLRKVEWHVLILIAGGMTLGVAMQQTGLSEVLVGLVTAAGLPPVALLITMVVFGIVISNFMSNTSAANLLIPIVVALGVVSPKVGAFAVAIACSLAMSLPISTPPNAIAFATRAITTRELARYGSFVSVGGILLLIGLILLLQQITDLL
jgi:sodium-dependent dicarboxylate transporter 2/3/5